MNQNHGGEKKWRNYLCNYVMRIDFQGIILIFMANSNISCHLGLAEDRLGEVAFSDPGNMKFSYIQGQSCCNWKTTMHQNVV